LMKKMEKKEKILIEGAGIGDIIYSKKDRMMDGRMWFIRQR